MEIGRKKINPYKWLVFAHIGIKVINLIAGHLKARKINKKKCAAALIAQFNDL